jgi:acetylornithine deacetylase
MAANEKERKPQRLASPAAAAAADARRLLGPLESEIVELLQSLVRTNSVAIPPNGSETEAQKVLLKYLRSYDLDVEMYDLEFLSGANHPYIRRERNYAGRHNLIARLPGSGGGQSLMLSGHMDTVPEGRNEWTESPWSGLVHQGKLYGRGSCDMKGGLAAAFAVAVALKRAGIKLGGDLLCESVSDEEWGGGGGTLAARLRGDIADACVIPEPTDFSVFRASRGGYVFDLEVRAGDPDSYFSKDEVISPAIPIGRLLGWVDGWAARRRKIETGDVYSGFSDPAPVQVLAVEANHFDADIPWSVPTMARLRLYFQFLPHEDVAAVLKEIEQSLRLFCAGDRFFRTYAPEWKAQFDPPLLGHELALDHQWTQALSRCASAVLETPALVTAAEYPCDAFLNQQYFGMPTLIFGPRGAGPHNANEYVEVRSVLQTAEVLLATALEWCGTKA